MSIAWCIIGWTVFDRSQNHNAAKQPFANLTLSYLRSESQICWFWDVWGLAKLPVPQTQNSHEKAKTNINVLKSHIKFSICLDVSCFSSPSLQEPKTDGYPLWDQNLCIVFDAHLPISLTGIDKIQHLSSICIHIILLIFTIHQASRPWLKVEIIHATKWWCARLSEISQIWSPNSSSPPMKRKVILPGNYL
jgi:hypothetical protein